MQAHDEAHQDTTKLCGKIVEKSRKKKSKLVN